MKLLLPLLASLCYPAQAFAYLDPGTGSMILQALIGLIAAVGVAWSGVVGKVREFFHRRQSAKGGDRSEPGSPE